MNPIDYRSPPRNILTYLKSSPNKKGPLKKILHALHKPREKSWAEVRLSKREVKAFEKGYFNRDTKDFGPIGELVYPNFTKLPYLTQMNVYKELFERLHQRTKEPNGLNQTELEALLLYTLKYYRLINGHLEGDKTNLLLYQEEMGIDEAAMERSLKVLAPILERSLVSALNKLPPYEGMLYRGDAMPPEELRKMQEDKKVLLAKKFLSCSMDPLEAAAFAYESQADYSRKEKRDYLPILYVIRSKSARDITKYSMEEEQECLFIPGRGFAILKIKETQEEGNPFVRIFLEEIPS